MNDGESPWAALAAGVIVIIAGLLPGEGLFWGVPVPYWGRWVFLFGGIVLCWYAIRKIYRERNKKSKSADADKDGLNDSPPYWEVLDKIESAQKASVEKDKQDEDGETENKEAPAGLGDKKEEQKNSEGKEEKTKKI